VNESVTEFAVTRATERFVTAPGFVVVGVTVTATELDALPLVAVIDAVPTARPSTSALALPICDTAAIAGLELDQATLPPLSAFPSVPNGIARRATRVPIAMLRSVGLRTMEAAGTSSTGASFSVAHAVESRRRAQNIDSRVVLGERMTDPPFQQSVRQLDRHTRGCVL
jgi:hypothetical protein